jgi:RNA polymerase sigma-70 factor (ECF subfamily)
MTAVEALPDADLVARIAAGDEAAFQAVYDRHVNLVYGATFRYVRDHASAEEVVQDVFVRLWRNADRYDSASGSLAGWLLQIARNGSIDRLRSAARRPQAVVVDEEHESALEAALSTDRLDHGAAHPDAEAIRSWMRAVVRSALSVMPQDERQALELAYDEGLTQVEISERTGWPLGTVKTRTRRALANMRVALEGVPDLAEHVEGRIGGRDGAR